MRLIRHIIFASTVEIILIEHHALAFTTNQPKTNNHCYHGFHRLFHQLYSYTPSSSSQPGDGISVVGVVAPLKYKGPYACLELNFPNITTDTLTFVLDTGASVSSIRRDLAETLNLPVVLRKEDLRLKGSVGGGGPFEAGDIVMLGNCTLGKLFLSFSSFRTYHLSIVARLCSASHLLNVVVCQMLGSNLPNLYSYTFQNRWDAF